MLWRSVVLAVVLSTVNGATRILTEFAEKREITQRCRYPNGESGICLRFEECPRMKQLADTNPGFNSVLFFLSKFECESEGGVRKICCTENLIEPQKDTSVKVHQEETDCEDPVGKKGVCTPIRGCHSAIHLVLNHRRHEEAMDFLRGTQCGSDQLGPKVCCHDEFEISAGIEEDHHLSSINKAKVNAFLAKSKLKKKKVPQQVKPTLNLASEKLPGSEYCGSREPFDHGIKHVTNGVNATLAEWPWMAALGYKHQSGEGVSFKCGGTLITNQHVLTAAHCFINKAWKLTVVRLGDLNLYSDSDNAEPFDATIDRILPHEQYSSVSNVNDIAIIVLREIVQFSGNIRPICLPITQELQSKPYNGDYLQIAGWGNTQSGRGQTSENLKDAVVLSVSLDECRQAYHEFRNVFIDDKVVCAGNTVENSPDACKGDSGGPIMDGFEPFYQVGITSFGNGCSKKGFPGVYTRVSYFMRWILDKVERTTKRTS